MINLMCSACNCVMCQLRPRMINMLAAKIKRESFAVNAGLTIQLGKKNCAELKELMKKHYGAGK